MHGVSGEIGDYASAKTLNSAAEDPSQLSFALPSRAPGRPARPVSELELRGPESAHDVAAADS
jgi:hypothetical protein